MTAKETNKKAAEEATTFVVDGEPVPEEVIIEYVQVQSALEAKQVELEELDRLQSTIEHGVEVFFTDAAAHQVKLEVVVVIEDLDTLEK